MATFTYGAWSRYDDGTWKNNTTGATATPDQIPVLENWSGFNKTAENQTLADQHFAQQQQLYDQALSGALPSLDPAVRADLSARFPNGLQAPQMGTLSMEAPRNQFAPALGVQSQSFTPWSYGMPLRGAQPDQNWAGGDLNAIATMVRDALQPQWIETGDSGPSQAPAAAYWGDQGVLMRSGTGAPDEGGGAARPDDPYYFKLANGNVGVLKSDGTMVDAQTPFSDVQSGGSILDAVRELAPMIAAMAGPIFAKIGVTAAITEAVGSSMAAKIVQQAAVQIATTGSIDAVGLATSAAMDQVIGLVVDPSTTITAEEATRVVEELERSLTPVVAQAEPIIFASVSGTQTDVPTVEPITTVETEAARLAREQPQLGGGLRPPAGALGENLPNLNTGPTAYPQPGLNQDITGTPGIQLPAPSTAEIAALPNILGTPQLFEDPYIAEQRLATQARDAEMERRYREGLRLEQETRDAEAAQVAQREAEREAARIRQDQIYAEEQAAAEAQRAQIIEQDRQLQEATQQAALIEQDRQLAEAARIAEEAARGALPPPAPLSNITSDPSLTGGTPAPTTEPSLSPVVPAAAGALLLPGVGGGETGLTPPPGALGENLPNINTGDTTYPPDPTVTTNLDPTRVSGPGIVLPPTTTIGDTSPLPNIVPPGTVLPNVPGQQTPAADLITPPLPNIVETPTVPPPPGALPPPADTVTPPPNDNITPPPNDPSLGPFRDVPADADPGFVDWIKKLGIGVLAGLGLTNADGSINWSKALLAGGLLAGIYEGTKPKESSVKQELPEWYTKASQEALAIAKQYADKGFEPYAGEAVAPLSANETAAIEMAKNAAGTWESVAKQGADLVAKGALPVSQADIRGYVNPAMADFFDAKSGAPTVSSMYGKAEDLTTRGALPTTDAEIRALLAPTLRDIDPNRVNEMYDEAGNLVRSGTSPIAGADISRLMNPYVELAYAPAKRKLERDLAMKQAQARASAVSRGAFGTDRQAIQDSLLNEAGLTALSDLYGTSYKTAFDEATKLATGEKDRSLTGGNTMYGAASNLGTVYNTGWNSALTGVQKDRTNQLTAGSNLFGAGKNLGDLTNTAWKSATDTATGNLDRMIEGGGALSDIATEGSNLTDADVKRLVATGALGRSVDQAKKDFGYQQYLDRLKFPTTAITNYAAALRGSPGSTTTTTPAPSNFFGETLGALGSFFNLPKTEVK